MALWTNMAEKCFNSCVTLTNTRLTPGTEEYSCLQNCVNKHVEANHRTVKNFTLLQEKFMARTQEFENSKQQEYIDKGILDGETFELKPMKPKSQQELEVEMIENWSPMLGKAFRWYYVEESTSWKPPIFYL